MVFWLNGNFEEDLEAINISDRGFLLGDGVFETLLAQKGVPAFLDEHLVRLQRGLEALKIVADMPNDIGTIIQTLIRKAGLEDISASVRISVTRGPAERGLKFSQKHHNPTALITTKEILQLSSCADTAIALKISKYVRPEKSVTARYKTLNYLDNILAHNDALHAGADDAIMLNSVGRVACASTSNIYILDNKGVVRTPPIEEGALPGIVRELLVISGAELGIDVVETPIEPALLHEGRVLLSNSLTGIRPAMLFESVNPWQQREIEILRHLQTWYNACLGENLAARALML